MISIAVIIMLHIRNGVYIGQIQCVADGYIYTSVYWFFGIEIAIVTNFIILNLNKNNFNVNIVLKQKSRASIWMKQVVSNGVISILVSSWISVCTYFASSLMSRYYINWSSVSSIYFKVNKVVCNSLDLKNVIILFVVYSSMRIFIMSIISSLTYWITNNKIMSWIVIVVIGVLEISIPLFYRVISIDYQVINDSGILIICFLYGLFLISILAILGIVFGKRREFYE